MFYLVFKGVTLSLTAILGIIGNMLTCVVLRRISLDNVFNQVRLVLSYFLKILNNHNGKNMFLVLHILTNLCIFSFDYSLLLHFRL